MRHCSSCDARLPDDQRRCLHCGGPTRPERDPRPPAAAPEGAVEELVLLARRQPAKARPLLERLRAAGIRFRVVGESGTEKVDALHGSYGIHAAIEIYVGAPDFEQADAIVHQELSPLATDFGAHRPGACPGCSFPLPDHAPECPECGLCFPD